MTTTIDLDGIVGWDITAADVRAALAEAGDAVTLRINSPGGDVHEGIAIANALRGYKRAGGQVEASIVGLAASMATYIAAFADRVSVEDNAVWMVHNPWSLAIGDHRTMQKAANVLGSIRGVLARAYAGKTARDVPAILAEMDDETWLYGAEIVESGYADALVPAGDGATSRAEAMALSQSAFAAMRAKIKEREADAARLDQIAALLPPLPAGSPASPMEQPMANPNDVAVPNEPAEDPTPNLDAAIAAAREAAVAAERQRIAAILQACQAVHQPQQAQAWIDEGISADQARERLINAMAANAGPELRHAPAPAEAPDFETLVQSAQAAGQTRAQALRAVIAAHPDLHRAWLARVNKV
jgi:ATP-dependent protease ClpP protease subunit